MRNGNFILFFFQKKPKEKENFQNENENRKRDEREETLYNEKREARNVTKNPKRIKKRRMRYFT